MSNVVARILGRPAANRTETEPANAVFMRFVTVGGATVELRNDLSVEERSVTIATCLGCGEEHSAKWAMEICPTTHWYTIQDRLRGESDARTWAQGHAEKCRATPRPTA